MEVSPIAPDAPVVPNPQQPQGEIIKAGDTVVIYMGIGNMKMEKMEAGGSINLHFGHFTHNSIIGRPFGSKIISVAKTQKQSYIYVLKPSPTLVTDTLARKTQILFTPDISAILFKLNISPGFIVVQAGTGSGSLSTSFSKVIAETGMLYTFQFNKQRSEAVAELFKSLGLSNVRVTHRDVVNDGFTLEDVQYEADALFLDVPNPWEVIGHAKVVLKSKGSRICCFSPCIEQVQKTCEELTNQRFKNIEIVEFLARNLERREKQLTNPISGEENKTVTHVYSSGPKTVRGHTGYLTFGELHG